MEITVKSEKFDRLLDALCILLEAEIKPGGIELANGETFIPAPPDNSAGGTIPPPPDNSAGGGPLESGIDLAPVELDAAGMPWDVRIHGKKKDKLAKTQEWKKIRGVDKALVIQVEAELRLSYPIPGGNAPPITTPPVITLPVQTPPAAPAPLLGKIMNDVALWAGAGTFTMDDVSAELLKLNIPNLAALPGVDENVLTVLDYNLGQAWTIKNTPA